MAYRALSPFLLFGLVEILSWGVYSISTLFLLLHIGEGVMKGEAASCLPNQSLALLQFKQSLSQGSRPLLSTWKNESDCCEWEGVSCDHDTGFVIGFYISKLGVKVSDPNSSLFQLSHLQSLDLSGNMVTGVIFSRLSNLTDLTEIRLSGCNFTGAIPDCFRQLSILTFLDLSENDLSGEIPPSLLNHPTLQHLYLGNNKLNGCFPDFGNESSPLVHVDLSYNMLYGEIPPSIIRKLSHLELLHLSNNQLQGRIPRRLICGSKSLFIVDLSDNQFTSEMTRLLYNCSNKYMWHLDLSNNRLTGSLPDNWPLDFDQLEVLNLGNNQLQGQIPRRLICGSQLSIVELSGNQFTGEMTRLFYNCYNNNMSVLDLSNNRLTGSLPDNLPTGFHRLAVLDLSNNQLQGPIPEGFSNSTTPILQAFNLNDNKLVGRIPRNLSMCSELAVINLGNNELSDVFPFWLGHLDQLRVLALHSNKLHGSISIPFSMHMFSSLLILDISGNQLKGHLPCVLFQNFSSMMRKETNVGSKGTPYVTYSTYQQPLLLTIKGQSRVWKMITILTSIDLSNNLFTGTIPEEIGALEELYLLNLSRNNLDGPIPKSFRQLQNMESLDLSHNNLSGSIPEELTNDTFLSNLDLSYNDLGGRIPQGNQFGTFNATSFSGNPRLCGPPLAIPCPSTNRDPQDSINYVKEMDRDSHWEYLAAGIGYVVGFLTTILPILFIQKVGTRFCVHVDRAIEPCISIPTLSSILCRA